MLLDRTEERALLDALLDGARRQSSGALTLHGEAGMGKTALIDYTVDRAPDLQLVRISGVEAEHEFGFAALHRLLLPFLGHVESLPGPQRNGLKVHSQPLRGQPHRNALSALRKPRAESCHTTCSGFARPSSASTPAGAFPSDGERAPIMKRWGMPPQGLPAIRDYTY